MTNALLLLWAAAIPLMMSPGPANLSLASIGVAFGFRRGLPFLAGIVTGTTGVLLLIAFGITAALLAQPGLTQALTIVAAIYILYLAWKIASAPVQKSETSATKAPAVFPGLVLALANPKAFAAIGAAYAGQTLHQGDLFLDALLKIAALFPVILVSGTGWLTFGAVFSELLSRPRIGRIFNISFAVMLVIFAVSALLQ
ncbi:LysE family translocator [Hoeflea sp.]|uniref:LysE family translocator n=1 Tax=Hoeflea sp. TaxID=1940281 RepID=UPI003B0223A2